MGHEVDQQADQLQFNDWNNFSITFRTSIAFHDLPYCKFYFNRLYLGTIMLIILIDIVEHILFMFYLMCYIYTAVIS